MKDDISYFSFLSDETIPHYDKSTGNSSIEKKKTVWM